MGAVPLAGMPGPGAGRRRVCAACQRARGHRLRGTCAGATARPRRRRCTVSPQCHEYGPSIPVLLLHAQDKPLAGGPWLAHALAHRDDHKAREAYLRCLASPSQHALMLALHKEP
eukprot:11226977-Lingulodinium_polyedra.AAC.1